LPARWQRDRSLDLGATMDRLPALAEAGVTDFLVHVRVPDSFAGARDVYSELVAAFEETTGR
jgi:hypothetical protein